MENIKLLEEYLPSWILEKISGMCISCIKVDFKKNEFSIFATFKNFVDFSLIEEIKNCFLKFNLKLVKFVPKFPEKEFNVKSFESLVKSFKKSNASVRTILENFKTDINTETKKIKVFLNISGKEILLKRRNTFNNEYIKMNNISISSTCSVKTESVYKTGHLIIKNNKMVIHQYESNKTEQNNELNNSIIETIDIFNPIFFIDFNMVTCELVMHKKK